MPDSTPRLRTEPPLLPSAPAWFPQACGLAALAGLFAYFLRVSWLRWPDPMIDSGPQWYAAWRVSNGASLFTDYQWNYGPLSAYFNAFLFKILGVSLHLLFAANLLIYLAILALAYIAFRRAWGWLGAVAACAVFISIFSFSALNSVGNYNYVSPYSHESVHGFFLLLLTVFAAEKWTRERSETGAFLLGTCGGLAAILKPEFMLAGGLLGLSALLLRFLQLRPLSFPEWFLLVAGVAWPTAAFTLGFAAREPLPAAFAHAANAWWVVFVKPIGVAGFSAGMKQLAGLDHPSANFWIEIKAGLVALLVIAGIRVGRIIAVAAVALAWAFVHAAPLGRCFPLITLIALILILARLISQWRANATCEPVTVMQWMLALAAAAMLARMPLLSRVDHLGFFQAALAGMLAAAFMIGEAAPERRNLVGLVSGFAVLLIACWPVARQSVAIHADQTQPVGAEADQFLAFDREVDPTGALVNWSVNELQKTPPHSLVLVIPDGWLAEVSEALSVNFLSRRVSPIPFVSLGSPESELLARIRKSPPDYIAEISGNFPGLTRRQYGAPGNPGELIVPWIDDHYESISSWGEPFSGTNLKGARILHRKSTTLPEKPPVSSEKSITLPQK
jgi:hypothetical protein